MKGVLNNSSTIYFKTYTFTNLYTNITIEL